MITTFLIHASFILRKNMSKNNSKSLSSLRQKLRKYNKDFEEEILKFRENPDQADEEEEEGEKGKLFARSFSSFCCSPLGFLIGCHAPFVKVPFKNFLFKKLAESVKICYLCVSEEVSGSESDAEIGPASFKKSISEPSAAEPKLPKVTSQDDDAGSEDSIDWGSDSESDSDSSEDDAQYTNIRERFLKR